MKKLGVLTSSRADYGILRPLLSKLTGDKRFSLELIVFGMHLMDKFGKTKSEIEGDSYGTISEIIGMPDADSPSDIANGYGELVKNFSEYWNQCEFDCVLVLGDRWEISAAVQAGIPFEIKFAHFHGGETTLGATDNIYRHQISLCSTYHFTVNNIYSNRVQEIIGSDENIYNVGSISLEEANSNKIPIWESVSKKYKIPFDDFVLVTFHPESVNYKRNVEFAKSIYGALSKICLQHPILITGTNADVESGVFHDVFVLLESENPTRIKLVSSLGKLNYFSAMRECQFLLGNTSSGIIEAASFNKWVINVGDRQKGRARNKNVIDISFDEHLIIDTAMTIRKRSVPNITNIFQRENTTNEIIKVLLEC